MNKTQNLSTKTYHNNKLFCRWRLAGYPVASGGGGQKLIKQTLPTTILLWSQTFFSSTREKLIGHYEYLPFIFSATLHQRPNKNSQVFTTHILVSSQQLGQILCFHSNVCQHTDIHKHWGNTVSLKWDNFLICQGCGNTLTHSPMDGKNLVRWIKLITPSGSPSGQW